jgi:FKBP-type peptidyl-prolyl cis-trans isomerase FkpA
MTKRFLYLLVAGLFSISACSSPENVSQESGDVAEDGSITTKSGLTYSVVAEGEGSSIANGEIANMHYTGWLYDENAPENKGDKFDSSRDRGEPLSFPLGAGRVIQGWDEGILGMKIGERRILVIPPDLGYGAQGYPPVIPGNSTLLFDVELLSVGPTQ